MKLTKTELVAAMKDLKKVATGSKSKRDYFHVLNNTLVYSDDDLTVIKKVSEKMEGDALAIPFKQFNALLTKSKAQTVEFEKTDNHTVVTFGKNAVSYEKIESKPQYLKELDNRFNINFNDFKELFNSVLYASGTQESRPILKGVRVALKDNKINAAATDSHRLATNEIELKHEFDNEIVIRSKELKKVLTMDFKEKITVSYDDNFINITDGETTAQIKLLEGYYPSIDRLIPQSSATQITVNRLKLIEALEMIIVFNKDNEQDAAYIQTDFKHLLYSLNKKDGTALNSDLNAKIDGDELNIMFNPNYLLEALKNATGELVRLEFTQPIRPFTIKGDDTTLHLVTPMRMH